MTPRILTALKGRDLRALQGFRDRVRSALGKRLASVKLLARRVLDVPAEAAQPRRSATASGAGPAPRGGLSLAPAPEAPPELEVAIVVERRDLWVEEQVDAAALDTALETGALVSALVLGQDELRAGAARASPVAARLERAEELP